MIRRAKLRAGERGIALLSVLGVLAVLLVLGSLVAGSSRIESALTGSSRFSARAFAAADAGLNYALGDADNFIDTTFTCNPSNPRSADLYAAGLGIQGDVDVCYEFESPPPPAIKISAKNFSAFHFDVAATGEGQVDASASLEMEVARIGLANQGVGP